MSVAAPVFVLTGPSGVGKGTLCRRLLDRVPQLELTVSATTRPPRAGERDGRDYHFLSVEQFSDRLRSGAFVEWAEYAGHRYGTLRSELERRVAAGRPVLLEIEVHGAAQVRRAFPQAVQIFIAPPSLPVLAARLRERGTETDEQIAERVRRAQAECAYAYAFDHVVVNDRLDDAYAQLERLVTCELSGTITAARPSQTGAARR